MYAHLRGPNQWPEQIPGFKENVTELMESMAQVGLTIIKAMAQVLQFDQDELMALFGEDYGVRCKLLRYPALNDPVDTPLEHGLGVGPHKDTGFLALLLQDDIGGLQVQTQDGRWVVINGCMVGAHSSNLTHAHYRTLNPSLIHSLSTLARFSSG